MSAKEYQLWVYAQNNPGVSQLDGVRESAAPPVPSPSPSPRPAARPRRAAAGESLAAQGYAKKAPRALENSHMYRSRSANCTCGVAQGECSGGRE